MKRLPFTLLPFTLLPFTLIPFTLPDVGRIHNLCSSFPKRVPGRTTVTFLGLKFSLLDPGDLVNFLKTELIEGTPIGSLSNFCVCYRLAMKASVRMLKISGGKILRLCVRSLHPLPP